MSRLCIFILNSFVCTSVRTRAPGETPVAGNNNNNNNNNNVQTRTGHGGPEGEQRYSCTLSLTSAIDGVGDQCHDPATLTPGKTRYPLYMRLGRPQGRSGWARKLSPPTAPRCTRCVHGLSIGLTVTKTSVCSIVSRTTLGTK